MARMKNALRQHLVAPATDRHTVPPITAFMPLAKYISDISDATDETIETEGFYDGDGTPETSVDNVAPGYAYTGFYDSTDAAQEFIADMKHETGEGRHCWQRVISANGTTMWTGHATVTGIVAGAGEATSNEDFACTIMFNQKPIREAVAPTAKRACNKPKY